MLMLLNFAHPESHNDRKQRRSGTCSQHSTFLYTMQRYFLGASLQENFTHVQWSTTAQLESAQRTTAPETLIHLSEVAAG